MFRFHVDGNVALDVASILLRPTTELAKTDSADHALASLQTSSIRCAVCCVHGEDIDHFLWECILAKNQWKLIAGKFGSITTLYSLQEAATIDAAPVFKDCMWSLPPPGYVKLNCDGASKGTLGMAGIGSIFRDERGDFRLAMWKKIGVNTNYMAEKLAILEALQIAIERG
ncbi:hypothetical protein IFM89_009454 [Coptis chinensis]|uniref:RNase H type-1 domain-containing protein n=1 Tax=Coptis chinensis TaxID=261450 RepID=A0A835LZ36_9MAGN|nr:hypothetical protein IFM89_009454 [Coptis chinensis]